ncbi:MAG: hypothetical protein AABY05_02985 [Nanoarchaeota archaeon]
MSDQIKEAFSKVKEEILSLKQTLQNITNEISEIKRTLKREEITQTKDKENPADTLTTQTDKNTPTDKIGLYSLKSQLSSISKGNDGVPADRQTDQQTDRQNQKFVQYNDSSMSLENKEASSKDRISQIDNLSNVLSSLDAIKKDLRSMFKKLTSQEMLVFSTLYQFTDQGVKTDYSLLASKTNLSESSIRDYIQKIIKKGVPIEKIKEDNKKVTLSIPSTFKRLANLSTILALREI